MNDVVKVYTKEEFNTEEPYRFLFEHRDSGFTYMQLFNELNANAERVGFKRFSTMVKAYFSQHEEHRGGINSGTGFWEIHARPYGDRIISRIISAM